jgi:hypothetical protein
MFARIVNSRRGIPNYVYIDTQLMYVMHLICYGLIALLVQLREGNVEQASCLSSRGPRPPNYM